MSRTPNHGDIPRNLHHDRMKELLERQGWVDTGGGKHVTKMVKPGAARPITLPHKKNQTYGSDLRARILRQAGLQGPAANTDKSDDARGERSW